MTLVSPSIRSKRLTNVAHGSVKELWAQVRSKAKARNQPILIGGNDASPDQLNQYFADISTECSDLGFFIV